MLLSTEQKKQIRNKVASLCEKAGIPVLGVRFNVTGKAAGNFQYKDWAVGFNEDIASRHWSEFENTIIHEVAHALDYFKAGMKFRYDTAGRRKLHDKVFKQYMIELGATEAKTYHSYKVEGVRRQRRWEYVCEQGHTLKVSTVIHNRIKGGQRRICNKCKTEINFTGKEL